MTGLYVFCSLIFIVGFIFRELGAFRSDDLVIYIVSICLCFAAPPLYELANYYMLGRILYYVPYHSPIHPGRVLTTFAAISIVVETLNGMGSSFVRTHFPLTPSWLDFDPWDQSQIALDHDTNDERDRWRTSPWSLGGRI